MLTNSNLAELLARESEAESGILSRAYRRAARSAFLWPEEVTDLIKKDRPLTELRAIGPFMTKRILRWIDRPPGQNLRPPTIRHDFIALADARLLLAKNPQWTKNLRGDLQMHSRYSDGSGTIAEMAKAALARHYEYIAITDHSKGLKIAGGIDEKRLRKQANEIARINESLSGLTVLSSIELNLNPRGEGDMNSKALAKLDVVLASFHSVLRVKHDQTARYLAAL